MIDSLKWMGHAGFVLDVKDMTVYLDPFILNHENKKADLVFITHPHFDHMNQEALDKIITEKTLVIAPSSCLEKVSAKSKFGVEPNNDYKKFGISFSTVPAYNVVKERLQNHPRENNWVGYIIDVDGKKVYHPGDTDFVEEMKKIDVDTALLPIGGTYTMDVDQAIGAAKAIKAVSVVPMHYKQVLGKDAADAAEKHFQEQVKNTVLMKEITEPRYSF